MRVKAARVAAHTRKGDSISIDDRVQAAIVGTLEGRLTWDPERIDLGRHLMSQIKTALTQHGWGGVLSLLWIPEASAVFDAREK